MIINNFGIYFDEFHIGQNIEHQLSKTIFESDNNLFCLLTMNHHPVHINEDYALNEKHQKILVVGTLVLSVVVGISVADISGKAIANLEYNLVKHTHPVFIGDTIYARSRILDKSTSSEKSNCGVIFVETHAFNQSGIKVLEFQRKVLIKKKEI